jgi:hypothetical protein
MKRRVELPRRTLAEVIEIHKIEPDVSDIVVEGYCDKRLIDWFVQESNVHRDVTVYEISNFEVPKQTILDVGLEDNNRGRVIAMAYAVEPHAADQRRITFIADRDFDAVLGISRTCALLLLTDYCNMEMYVFNDKVLNKYLHLAVPRRFPKSAAQLIVEIQGVLQSLFLVRLANFQLGLKLESVNWESSCELRATVEIDLDDYLNRYLNKNGRHAEKVRLLSEIEIWKLRLLLDARYQIQGHDFIKLLSWYIAQHHGFSRIDEDDLHRGLFSAVDLDLWSSQAMFRALLDRLTGSEQDA